MLIMILILLLSSNLMACPHKGDIPDDLQSCGEIVSFHEKSYKIIRVAKDTKKHTIKDSKRSRNVHRKKK